MVGNTVQRGARLVRIATWWAVGGYLCGLLALTLFHTSLRADVETVTAMPAPDPVAAVVQEIEARGYQCGAEPQLVDQVIFEWLDGTVSAIGFDDALRSAGDGAGWVREYCATAVAPAGSVVAGS